MATIPSSRPNNPSTPNYADTYTFVDAYLEIHTMSAASYRYAYILWLCIFAAFLVFAILHWSGRRGGAVGAWFSTWLLRRRTWRKQSALEAARRNPSAHRQPFSLPSNAQLLSLVTLTAFVVVVSFVGPDYIAPSAHLWKFDTPNPPRSVGADPLYNRPPSYTIKKSWWTV